MVKIEEEKQIFRVHITTTITTDLMQKAADNHIKMSEALRVGVGVLLAEKGDDSYTGALNIYRKLNKYRELLEHTSQELENLKK